MSRVLFSLLGSVHAFMSISNLNTITMDSDDCGKAIDIYDKEYVKFAKEAMTTTKPNFGCVITIRSGYKDSNYQVEITPDMFDITNCGVVLYIYDEGSLPAGTTLKRLSCTSMGTGDIFYSKSGSVTFELINQDPMYQLNFDFTIKVRAFHIQEAIDVSVSDD